MVALNRRRIIQRGGTGEPAWQHWLRTAGLTNVALHEWLPRTARLVVVAPHPDDEVLASGGLMAMHSDRGGQIMLVAVTDGEASHAHTSRCQARALAAQRCAESMQGLVQLGIAGLAVERLKLPDGRVAHYIARLALRLQVLLRATDVVVTTWRMDGHPDHDATGFAASLACGVVGSRLIEAPVWMWDWASPGDTCVPWNHLRSLPLTAHACDRKQTALTAHASQLDSSRGLEGAVLGADIVARANRTAEYFFSGLENTYAAHR